MLSRRTYTLSPLIGAMANNARSGGDWRRQQQRRQCPFLVPVFALLNVLIFTITMFVNNCPQHASNCILRSLGRFSFQSMDENPLLGPSSSTLIQMGGLSTHEVVVDHQIWRFFTCLWLHAGLIQLLVNDLSLLFIGTQLEWEFGLGHVGSIYILSGIGGSFLAELFLQHRVTAAASAPLFGLLGAVLSDLVINWSLHTAKCTTITTVIMVAIVNLAIGIMPHANNFAHIGGFIFGFSLGCILFIKPQLGWGSQIIAPPGSKPSVTITSKYTSFQIVMWIGAIIILLIGFQICRLWSHGFSGG